MERNITLYPWFKFTQSLVFWQATWFLFFEGRLSASEAIMIYVVYDVSSTVLEVPSGYLSDRMGRRVTLICAGVCSVAGMLLFVFGDSFAQFAMANVLMGAGGAFASGTDTSLLFESLSEEGRADEVEAAELRAWRFSFVALAVSALAGGAMALWGGVIPYIATAIAAAVTLCISLAFREPAHQQHANHSEDFRILLASLRHPTLLWLFVLTLLMYVFSHIPFVFGQPFLRETLTEAGLGAETPLVSGAVTCVMMIVSVAVSWVAMPLRKTIGLAGLLLFAFAMQIGLTAALAASNGIFVIGLLFLRMVPDSLSKPFITARIQPLLDGNVRATYLSVQSLAGRVLFAATLSLAAGQVADAGLLPYSEMQIILRAYAGAGVVVLLALALFARRARVNGPVA